MRKGVHVEGFRETKAHQTGSGVWPSRLPAPQSPTHRKRCLLRCRGHAIGAAEASHSELACVFEVTSMSLAKFGFRLRA
jgi:hypothetical protein